MARNVKVGIVQAAAPHLDLPAAMKALDQWVLKAAQQQIELLAFGETWLTGYPSWLDYCPNIAQWGQPATKKAYARLYKNSIAVPGPEVQHIGHLAKKHNMVIMIGANEHVAKGPGHGTIYNALLVFNTNGQLVNHHRKLVPTYTEKMLYGPGDAAGLQAVDTSVARVGGLVCWEHWMPLSRQALHNSQEEIHLALWPKVHEMHQVASRQYAFEARCFVLAAGQVLTASSFPQELELPPELAQNPQTQVLNGGSCIIGPDGAYVLEPQWEVADIVSATIDLDRIQEETMTLDVTGHYYRPDIFSLNINKERR